MIDPAYDIHIRDNATGEVRIYREDLLWGESSAFFWTEGNFGCDCNRSIVWRRANWEPEPEPVYDADGREVDPDPCGDGRFTVLRAVMLDTGRVVPLEDDDA